MNYKLQEKAEWELFSRQQKCRETLIELGKRLMLTRDIDKLLMWITEAITSNVDVCHTKIFLWDAGSRKYTLRKGHCNGCVCGGSEKSVAADDVIVYLRKARDPLLKEDMLSVDHGQAAKIFTDGAELIVPLLINGKLTGFMELGKKENNSFYTSEDVSVFQILAGQAALAIENAEFHEKQKKSRKMLARLYRKAVTDGVTGVYNRTFFDNTLIKSVSEAQRYGKKLSLVLIDVDNFKDFNDLYGHPAGDIVLRAVAEEIRKSTRISDIPARYGGDEFAVILPETGPDGAAATANKIGTSVSEKKLSYRVGEKEFSLQVTLSIGFAAYCEGESRIDLVKKTDRALYQAKKQGRNQVCSSAGKEDGAAAEVI